MSKSNVPISFKTVLFPLTLFKIIQIFQKNSLICSIYVKPTLYVIEVLQAMLEQRINIELILHSGIYGSVTMTYKDTQGTILSFQVLKYIFHQRGNRKLFVVFKQRHANMQID